ncbi:DNA-directed RNA polymerase subunit alpha C-terminal domain-containing protein [Paenibacillus amylolyticus]|uniref:DNA-directed RNA polymerase subunit alpha C-terminal domain-containing protein n=1 Tax=Paenibacillus amylolyticus TaxID=1451 RepID=UPI00105664F1
MNVYLFCSIGAIKWTLSLREIFNLADNFEYNLDLEELLTPVDHSFEKRMYLCLMRHRINTIEQLMDISYMELCKIRLFGTASQNRLYQLLNERF